MYAKLICLYGNATFNKSETDAVTKILSETGKTFPVLDGSGAFRLERGVNNLIAANAGLVLSYPDGDRSTRAVLTAEPGTKRENDIKTGTKAMELLVRNY